MEKRRRLSDPLEQEYAHYRISLGAYGAACLYRSILERTQVIGVTKPPLEKQMRLFSKDRAVVGAIVNREWAQEHQRFVISELGADDERLVRRILLEKHTFASLAFSLTGSASDRQRKAVGRRFREACEDLAIAYSGHRATFLSSRHPAS